MDLQVHGAVYNLFTGEVNWLGQHEDLESLIGCSLPLHNWKIQPYVRGDVSSVGRDQAKEAIRILHEGNQRFVQGNTKASNKDCNSNPFAIITGSGEAMPPFEKIFDVAAGSVIVQRTMGGISNTNGEIDTFTASIEYSVARHDVKLIVILGEADSRIVTLALGQLNGAPPPSDPMRRALTDMTVNGLRAIRQVEDMNMLTAAGRARKINSLTAELNALYTIEHLLLCRTLRAAVINRGLEMHIAIHDSVEGTVEFLGEHPMLNEICDRYEKQDAS